MRVMTGKVVEGKVVVEGVSLEEGSTVTVLAPESEDDTFELSPEQESLLLEAIGEIERGEGVDARKVLKELGHRD